MKLYLVRHGEAVSRSQDPERPLSQRGRSDVEGVATRLAKAGAADRNACRVKLPGGVQSAQEDRARTPANQRQPLRPENRADFRGFRICPEVVTGPGRSSMIALDLYGKGSSS